jgi:hypothetical protein
MRKCLKIILFCRIAECGTIVFLLYKAKNASHVQKQAKEEKKAKAFKVTKFIS